MDGANELRARLRQLVQQVEGPLAARAVRAGVDIVAREIRSEIDRDPGLSDDQKRQLKPLVGRGSRRTEFGAAGKAGFGVGQVKGRGRSGRHRSGVGITPQTVHWHVLGTEDRYVGRRSYRTKNGRRSVVTRNVLRFAGRLRPTACVLRAVSGSRDAVSRAMATVLQRGLSDRSS